MTSRTFNLPGLAGIGLLNTPISGPSVSKLYIRKRSRRFRQRRNGAPKTEKNAGKTSRTRIEFEGDGLSP